MKPHAFTHTVLGEVPLEILERTLLPAKVGIAAALWISRATHAIGVAALVGLGLVSPELCTLYFIGVALTVALLVIEQAIVKPNDLSKVGLAFFTINGIVSLLLGTLGIIDVLLS